MQEKLLITLSKAKKGNTILVFDFQKYAFAQAKKFFLKIFTGQEACGIRHVKLSITKTGYFIAPFSHKEIEGLIVSSLQFSHFKDFICTETRHNILRKLLTENFLVLKNRGENPKLKKR